MRKLAVIQQASLHGGRPEWKRGLATASASCVCSSHLRSHKQLLTWSCKSNNHDRNLNRVRTSYLPVSAKCGQGYWSGLILPLNPPVERDEQQRQTRNRSSRGIQDRPFGTTIHLGRIVKLFRHNHPDHVVRCRVGRTLDKLTHRKNDGRSK